jgi:PAS domain S-box-containing protein
MLPMDELVQIITVNFEAITDLWVSTILSLPKYFGSAQAPFFKTQISELLECILDQLKGNGTYRLTRFMERIVKPPYSGLLTLTTVHETFLLGEDAILSIVRDKMVNKENTFEYSRRIDSCFHEIIYQYANAYQTYQTEVNVARRKNIERQRETLLRFTNAIGSANSYKDALTAAMEIIKEEARATSVEFFSFDQDNQMLTSVESAPSKITPAGANLLKILATQFGNEPGTRRSYSIMQETTKSHRVILVLPTSAGDSLIGLLLLSYPPVPLRESSVAELQEENLNILLAMADQLGYGLKRFLLEEEVMSKVRYISTLTENSADAIIGLDEEGKIVSWNRGAALLFGFQTNEVNGKSISVLSPQRHPTETFVSDQISYQQDAMEILDRINRDGVVKNFEMECTTKTGQRVVVSLTGSVLKDENGNSIGMALIMRDVTQLKQYEMELRQTEKLSFIGQISAGIAHEIGTPLNIILGNAEYLMMDTTSGEKNHEELKVIISETNRIAKLIQQLLDFARPKRMRPKAVDLNSEIRNVLQLLKSQLDKSSIELSLHLQENLSPILGDAAQLQEVFVNLIVNAIHSMESGGKLIISTELVNGKDGNNIQVTISDTGCGIPEENLQKIFNPFFTTKEVGKGTGLGLAITQRIVQDHKGTITVKSKINEGTVFKLSFPVYNNVTIDAQPINNGT